ncbi:hypothetical protein [Brevibacterium jeotgali]|uniref:Uncharacterized protein n=1 Tax=Brevibacterium jeotgali TaxID=1262550 RepID=A0A2H1L9A3_9MICO|nr:hypothetical protein [Brevibacterium jeotgali]TWC03371.1 hypothetical protein FB108_2096 [Brevibacterium jeotgali]SMY13033.1 hypothetical protein BJEO58_02641 [Brevibacterium jeotgali]
MCSHVTPEPRALIDLDQAGRLWFFARVPYDQVDDELDTRDATLTIVGDSCWISVLGRATPHHVDLQQMPGSWRMDPQVEHEPGEHRPMLFAVRPSTAHSGSSPGSTPVSTSMRGDVSEPLLEPYSPISGPARHRLQTLTESEHLS